MNRTLVIGDIHGGLRALHQILERANVTKNDTLIFLGDYVDGWSQSPEVIDYLIELNQQQNCIFIRGNHDELLLDWLTYNDENIDEGMWFKHGGEATVIAYANVSENKKNIHIEFLKSLQNFYLDEHNRLFVPKLFYWDRTLWETALALDETIEKSSVFYPRRLALYKEIYIGHTPVTRIKYTIPTQKANVWNIDTGAAFKGPLTIIDINTKEYWQSEFLPTLYPTEKGRN